MDNSRFKFRAWDKRRELMSNPFDITDIRAEEYDGSAWLADCCFSGLNDGWDNFELMQFTGLKDKNGKEIYEGDIITNETEIVVSEYGVLDYTGEFQKTKCSVTYNSHFCMFNLTEDVHHGKFEVIGNIYENPELLNK